MWKGAPKEGFAKAVRLRNRLTKSEELLWDQLRNKKLSGLKFRRQHPIHIYIADFYCHKYRLIIEIDGGYHETQTEVLRDNERTKILQEFGCEVIRFTNREVEENITWVLERISEQIAELEHKM